MINLNAFEVKVHAQKHFFIIHEKFILPVPDCMLVIVLDDLLVVQKTQDQLIDGLEMVHINLLKALH